MGCADVAGNPPLPPKFTIYSSIIIQRSLTASDPRWVPVAIQLAEAAVNESEPAFTLRPVFADRALTPSTKAWLRTPSCWGDFVLGLVTVSPVDPCLEAQIEHSTHWESLRKL